MNSLLIEALSVLNSVLALVIIGLGGVGGFLYADQIPEISPNLGLVLGALAGLIIASIICGAIAALVQTERHLRVIARNSQHLG